MKAYGSRTGWITLVLMAVGLAAAQAGSAGEQSPPPSSSLDAVSQDVSTVSSHYERWVRVSDWLYWSPWSCVLLGPGNMPTESTSGDEATHGRKLYFLFAMDPEAYLAFSGRGEEAASYPKAAMRPGITQVIVKESWHPQEVPEGEQSTASQADRNEPADIVKSSTGKMYRKGDFAGLFIMMKYDNPPIPADDGWVYATVAADRKTILQSGRIDSCMGCHQNAPHGRLFGLAENR